MISSIGRYKRELSVAAAYLLLLLTLTIVRIPGRPSFFAAQFRDTWISAVPLLVAAVGMTLVILTRQIDISIGSQFSICGIVAALLAQANFPIGIVALGTLTAGAVMGAMNGVLVAAMGLPSIVVTLATMVILRGSLLWARQGAAVVPPPGFQWFGAGQRAGERLLLLAALAVFALFALGLRWLAAGRSVYAVGSDQEAARLAGVRVRRVGFVVFVIMGALTALAAMLNAVQLPTVYPNNGDGFELKVIAAVVVGGVAITGGRGTLIGTLIGVALLASVRPAFEFLDVPPEWERAAEGAIILAAVASDGLRRRGR